MRVTVLKCVSLLSDVCDNTLNSLPFLKTSWTTCVLIPKALIMCLLTSSTARSLLFHACVLQQNVQKGTKASLNWIMPQCSGLEGSVLNHPAAYNTGGIWAGIVHSIQYLFGEHRLKVLSWTTVMLRCFLISSGLPEVNMPLVPIVWLVFGMVCFVLQCKVHRNALHVWSRYVSGHHDAFSTLSRPFCNGC